MHYSPPHVTPNTATLNVSSHVTQSHSPNLLIQHIISGVTSPCIIVEVSHQPVATRQTVKIEVLRSTRCTSPRCLVWWGVRQGVPGRWAMEKAGRLPTPASLIEQTDQRYPMERRCGEPSTPVPCSGDSAFMYLSILLIHSFIH